MAIDFVILGLLLISLSINLLALGAFWVTPGLRTTANRFVINLLIVNIIGCITLAPTLFLTSKLTINENDIKHVDDSIASIASDIKNDNIPVKTDQQHMSFILNDERNIKRDRNSKKLFEENVDIINGSVTAETLMKCIKNKCEKVIMKNGQNGETIVITEINTNNNGDGDGDDDDNSNLNELKQKYSEMDEVNDEEEDIFYDDDDNDENQIKVPIRCWSIDLAAALGALSVLLVVGDTWCAVTDPLRYHSRISGLKAWVLIAMTWTLGIFFGILSALRENLFNGMQSSNSIIEPSDLYNMMYSCFYFIVIILLPFGFVCGMYWRIFSEARENGLRVRQNGSSPLLQSALNLSTGIQHQQQRKESLSNNGLTMKIDRRCSSDRESSKPLLTPILSHRQPSGDDQTHHQRSQPEHQHLEIVAEDQTQKVKPDRNQNILLTISSANEELKRNYSARQLRVLGSSQDLNDSNYKTGMRHTQSSPNLQKDRRSSSFTEFNQSQHPHSLQLPAIHASPKAPSYMTSIRHRLSNASSLFKYREETRAARISILVVIMFMISYLPFGLLVLLQGRLSSSITNSTQISIILVFLGNISSPFIFAYRNKRVLRGVKRLFGLDPKYRERQLNRNIGLLGRCSTKANINVRRSVSKVSSYSVNSCKFLNPYAVQNGKILLKIEKYGDDKGCTDNKMLSSCPIKGNAIFEKTIANCPNSMLIEKRSILKLFCDSSRKFGCATSRGSFSDNEQVDV